MEKNQIGVVGMAPMGSNLAMNLADHAFRVAIFNRSRERTDAVIAEYGTEKGISPQYELEEFVSSLERPRKVILMVKAGEATDTVITQLAALLEVGDILIDGGNSYFRDTIRRVDVLKNKGIRFIGMGISGGEEGARRGPSIMPGVVAGSPEWEELRPILAAIAAQDFDGQACVAPIGIGGAGHFVKMVHNGIEYADMQFIAEAYWLMKNGLGLTNDEMADVFASWNSGRLQSYLIEITAHILRVKEADGGHIVDRILDTAGAKGTGAWTGQEALTLGAPALSIVAAVFARSASANKSLRLTLAKRFHNTDTRAVAGFTVNDIEQALYAAKLIAYAQGYELLSLASKEYGWDLDLGEISRIWQGGCIIRAQFLRELSQTYGESLKPEHVLLSNFAQATIASDVERLRKVAVAAMSVRVPIPGFLSSLSYFDMMCSATLSANLIQAQRDFFGAHTFQRALDTDSEHFDWGEK
jgi:6-phosphogluconate dehydrogenase